MGRALLNALTLSGDALLAAVLAPRCVCCRCPLESALAARSASDAGKTRARLTAATSGHCGKSFTG
jgi:hypothetical protein